ncbi:hypothetical protein ACJIZ3_013259 [Penstemon smallii]|uniref:Cysteine protease n=1 Tax=Penstemon smallii TaxID=265156 RepID=A0ABD3USZ0_9LAMI
MASNRKTCFFMLLSIFAVLSYRTTSLPSEDYSMSIKHETWMARHKRYYDNNEEREKRFNIFKDNVKYIESFNRVGGQTYELEVNAFADLTKEEFLTKYAGNYMPSLKGSPSSSFKYENVKEVSPSLDWRDKGAVTPVQNQAHCGACWAFSAVAAIEGIVQIKSGVQTSLSEQHIMDCDGAPNGCQGGRMEHAFEFVNKNGVLASDKDYPYQMAEGTCSWDHPSSLAVKINGYERVPSKNETALLMAVANQPVSVAIDPSLFQFYKSGVLKGKCGTKLTHAVAVVGYGTNEDGIKFWLLKNSWGGDWGENGYIRLERGIDDIQGMCGLAIDATYPTA